MVETKEWTTATADNNVMTRLMPMVEDSSNAPDKRSSVKVVQNQAGGDIVKSVLLTSRL